MTIENALAHHNWEDDILLPNHENTCLARGLDLALGTLSVPTQCYEMAAASVAAKTPFAEVYRFLLQEVYGITDGWIARAVDGTEKRMDGSKQIYRCEDYEDYASYVPFAVEQGVIMLGYTAAKHVEALIPRGQGYIWGDEVISERIEECDPFPELTLEEAWERLWKNDQGQAKLVVFPPETMASL